MLTYVQIYLEGKSIPGQAQRLQEVEARRFQDKRHMKLARLSSLRIGRVYPQEIPLVHISVRG